MTRDIAAALCELRAEMQRSDEKAHEDIKAEVRRECASLRHQLKEEIKVHLGTECAFLRQQAKELRDARPEIDFSPVLCEVRRMQSQIDGIPVISTRGEDGNPDLLQLLLKAFNDRVDDIEELKDGLSSAVRKLEEGRLAWEFSDFLDTVKKEVNSQFMSSCGMVTPCCSSSSAADEGQVSHRNVDLAPVLDELRQMRSQVQHLAQVTVLSKAAKSVESNKREVDSFEVLRAIQAEKSVVEKVHQMQCQVDATMVTILRTLREGIVVDVSAVVKAIEVMNAEVLRTLNEHKPQAKLCKYEVSELDTSTVVKAVEAAKAEVLVAVKECMPGVDALQALKEHKPEVDFLPVLRAIDESKSALDCSHHLRELGQAVDRVKSHVDLAPVLHEVLCELKLTQSQVSTGISTSSQHLREVRQVVDKLRSCVDLAPILGELKLTQSEVNSGTSTILKTLGEGSVAVDCSAVLRAIGSVKEEVNFAPVIEEIAAVRRTAQESKHGIQEIREACSERREAPSEVNASPFLKEMRELQEHVESGISKVLTTLHGVLHLLLERETGAEGGNAATPPPQVPRRAVQTPRPLSAVRWKTGDEGASSDKVAARQCFSAPGDSGARPTQRLSAMSFKPEEGWQVDLEQLVRAGTENCTLKVLSNVEEGLVKLMLTKWSPAETLFVLCTQQQFLQVCKAQSHVAETRRTMAAVQQLFHEAHECDVRPCKL